MKQRTKPGAARRSITALAAGLALLLSGSSMPSDPDGSLPPLSGASANLWGALAIDSNQGPSWGWAVDWRWGRNEGTASVTISRVHSVDYLP